MNDRSVKRQTTEQDVVPPQVVESIVQFADANTAPLLRGDVVPEAPRPIPHELAVQLRVLSPIFKPGLEELAAEYAERNAVVYIQATDHQAVDKIYAVALSAAETLAIRAGDVRDRVFNLATGLDLVSLDSLLVDWNRVFAACSRLQRLDLRCMPLHSIQLVKILDAASRHCKNLVALLLPVKDNLGPECETESHSIHCKCVKALQPLMETLLVAIKRWFEDGNVGGLRQLHVPQRNVHNLSLGTYVSPEYSMMAQTDTYLKAVAAFCPNVEFFDGYRSSFHVVEKGFNDLSDNEGEENGEISCDEFLYCSPEVWREFCQSCTKLREFNWFVVPFSPEYFESFAKYPKPHLRELTVAHGSHFNFRVYDSAFSEEFHSGHDGIMASIVAICPALQHFRVVFLNDYEGYDGGDVLIGGENSENRLRWSDDDLETIATTCPLLESVELVLVRNGEESHKWELINA